MDASILIGISIGLIVIICIIVAIVFVVKKRANLQKVS